MTDFDPHLSVETISTANDVPLYTIKEMTLDHLNRSIKTPFKVLSGTKISRKAVENQITGIPFPIFESGKYFVNSKSYEALNSSISDSDWIPRLNRLIGVDNNIVKDFNTTVSLVFRYYPLNDVDVKIPTKQMDFSSYECLLDYVDRASSAFVLTPDVCLYRQNHLSIERYLSFISRSVESFERRNNKPIFVPLQVDLSDQDIRKILEFYRNKKYSNIWINFNAKSCDGTYSARLRMIDRLLDEFLGHDYVLYSSHMQKDMQPQLRNPQSAASDVLIQYLGSDFVGITRSPYRPYHPNKPEKDIARDLGMTISDYQQRKFEHKRRLFDRNTYYYYLPSSYPSKNELPNLTHVTPEQIDFQNSIAIHQEFSHVREVMRENRVLKSFLLEKKSLRDNQGILRNILSPRQRTKQIQRTKQMTLLSPDPFQFLGGIE